MSPTVTPTAASPHHTLVSFEVTGGGFLKDARLNFADGLNCIIGGRGTGKSSVLRLLRFALDPSDAGDKQVQAVLRNGTVRVGLRTKYGVTYVAERAFGSPTRVVDGDGVPVTASLDALFVADSFHQIETIACDPAAQLRLLDRFATDEIKRYELRIKNVVRDLAQNAAELLAIAGAVGDLEAQAAEAPAIQEKLKTLVTSDSTEAVAIGAAHADRALRERENQAMETARKALSAHGSEARSAAANAARRLGAIVDDALLSGKNREAMRALAALLSAEASDIEEEAARRAHRCALTVDRIFAAERALAVVHAEQDATYRTVIAKSAEESAVASERTRLQAQLTRATQAATQLDLVRNGRRLLRQQRRELVASLSILRDERYAARSAVVDTLRASLGPQIRVTIVQGGDASDFGEKLAESLKGSGIKFNEAAKRISEKLSPEEFVRAVEERDVARLGEAGGLDEARVLKIVGHLADTEALYALESAELHDVPKIELRDGDQYKDSAEVSTGQSCTAVLPLLFVESERPLLIDQPEDNLDGEFIYATVVPSLMQLKTARQAILVTHNPNIPVLGEAERVFVMASDGRCGRAHKKGTVDEVKDEIERVMEGGREAFARRMARYGH